MMSLSVQFGEKDKKKFIPATTCAQKKMMQQNISRVTKMQY